MTVNKFQSVYEGLCDLVQAPRIELGEPVDGAIAFHMKRHGVVVNVLYFPQTCAEHVFTLTEFGPIPHEDPRAYHALLALLNVNFLLPQLNPPALARNPVSGDIVLRCVYVLADATPDGLLELIDQGAELALDWRQDFFLGDDAADQLRPIDDAAIPMKSLA